MFLDLFHPNLKNEMKYSQQNPCISFKISENHSHDFHVLAHDGRIDNVDKSAPAVILY